MGRGRYRRLVRGSRLRICKCAYSFCLPIANAIEFSCVWDLFGVSGCTPIRVSRSSPKPASLGGVANITVRPTDLLANCQQPYPQGFYPRGLSGCCIAFARKWRTVLKPLSSGNRNCTQNIVVKLAIGTAITLILVSGLTIIGNHSVAQTPTTLSSTPITGCGGEALSVRDSAGNLYTFGETEQAFRSCGNDNLRQVLR